MHAVKTQILLKIAEDEKLENPRIEFASKTSKADGFLSITEMIDLKGTNKDLHLVLKTATENLEVRSLLPIPACFHNEVNFYNKVVPMFNSIRGDVQGLDYAPRCYFASLEELKEIVVLENINPKGFIMWDRMVPQDQAHVEKTLEGFARLHAFSLVAMVVKKQEFLDLVGIMKDNLRNWLIPGGMMKIFSEASNINKELVKDEMTEIKEAFEKHCQKIEDYMLNYDSSNDPLAVMAHVDCWCNNVLYKYDQNLKPVDVRIIDYQFVRFQSLIFDLSLFLCACTDEKTWKNMDHFLKVYHTHLSNAMKKLGATPENLVPYEVLLSEFKKKCKFGFALSAFWLKVVLMGHDEAPEIENVVGDGYMEKFLNKIKMQDEHDRRMRFLIKHFVENGYLGY